MENKKKKIKKKKEKKDNKKKIKDLKEKCKEIEVYIKKHFQADDIKSYKQIVTHNFVKRISQRLKSQTPHQRAKYIECMVQENESEFLDNIEKWLTVNEKNKSLDPEILHYAKRMLNFKYF